MNLLKVIFKTLVLVSFISFPGIFTFAGSLHHPGEDSVSQRFLYVQKNSTIHQIPPGKKIKVWLKDSGITLKGKYKMLSDSTIEINQEVIYLYQIEKVSGVNVMTFLCPPLAIAGVISFGVGLELILTGLDEYFTSTSGGPPTILSGLGLIIAGPVAIIFAQRMWYASRPYKMKKWKLVVKKQDIPQKWFGGFNIF